MSDPTVAAPPEQRSHEIRMTFEQLGTIIGLVVLSLAFVACFIALIPMQWAQTIAERIVELKDSITDFLMTLGGMLGLSWTRGHMDERISNGK